MLLPKPKFVLSYPFGFFVWGLPLGFLILSSAFYSPLKKESTKKGAPIGPPGWLDRGI